MPKLVRGPDVCFVAWRTQTDRTVDTVAISKSIPDLVVEVLSPRNTCGEMARKRKDYFFAGVRLVWQIDPRSLPPRSTLCPIIIRRFRQVVSLAATSCRAFAFLWHYSSRNSLPLRRSRSGRRISPLTPNRTQPPPNRLAPRRELLLALGGRHFRLEPRRAATVLPGSSHRSVCSQRPRGTPRQEPSIRLAQPRHRPAENVGLELQEPVVADIPPSTLSAVAGCDDPGWPPRSLIAASIRSATWNATPSSAARPRSAAVVAAVRPKITPRASGTQCGAPNPRTPARTAPAPPGSIRWPTAPPPPTT